MEHAPPKKITKSLWDRTKKLIFSVSLFASFLLIVFSGMLLKKNLDEHIQFLGRSLTQALKYHISSGEVYVLSEMAHEFETQKWCKKIIVTDQHFKVVHSKMSSGLPDEFYMTKVNPNNYEYRFPIQSEGIVLGHVLINKNNMQFWLPFTLSCFMIFGSMIILYLIFIKLSLNKMLKNAEAELTSIYQKSEQKLQEAVQEKELEKSRKEAIALLSSQVAHDIRSPLAALSSMTKDLSELPEEKRILLRSAIQRIDDIANDLSQKKHVPQETVGAGSKPAHVGAIHELPLPKDTRDVYLLSSLIEPVVSEKRFEYREKLSIEIRSDLDENSYGLFSRINSKEFKRILSNLINNAIEAFGPSTDSLRGDSMEPGQGDKGQIVVSLNDVGATQQGEYIDSPLQKNHDDNLVMIQIKDNGKGIPPEILPKLMERGASFGKEGQEKSGSGLGLYHAKTTLQSWGGDLKIESKTNHSTTVTLFLKKEPSPKWFVPRLEITQNTNIVAVDDDNSIHEVWNTRLHRYIKDKRIRITHLANPKALREYVGARSPRPGEGTSPLHVRPSHVLFLCDYEFLGHKQNGLDIIEELNIPDRSILVTSRYEEPRVRERAARLNVRLIPKPLAGFVPIVLNVPSTDVGANLVFAPEETGTPQEVRANTEVRPYKASDKNDSTVRGDGVTPPNVVQPQQDDPHKPHVLIDDDILIHTTWKMTGKERDIIVHPYVSLETFSEKMHLYPKDTDIYIDSNLGKGQKGEDIAKILYEKGFRNIYLTTGTSPELFPKMPWIKKVIGKTPPWVEE